jgi:hypothetical protein
MNERTEELRKELLRRELASRQKEQQPHSWLERNIEGVDQYINKPIEKYIVNPLKAGLEVVGGYGQGIANIAPGLYNLGASGINALGGNVTKSPMIDVVPHSPASTTGEIASFFAPGSALKLLSKAPAFMHTTRSAMKIPMIAESIKHASNILGKSPLASRTVGNALLGGAYTPENPLAGLGLGVAGGLVGEGIGKLAENIYNSGVKKGVGKTYNDAKNTITETELYKKFNPARQAKELEHYLSNGTNNITENSRKLATDIRNAYTGREAESGIHFDYALKQAGHEPIYGTPHRDIFPGKVPEYAREQNTINKIKDLNVGDIFDIFKSNPTFDNAHKLQSELGFIERDLKGNPLKTQEDRIQLKKVIEARTQLKDDISNFLEKRDLTNNHQVSKSYKKGSELYEANVSPYLSNKKLLDIVRKGKTVVKDLHTIFDTPSNTITKEGLEKIGSINKIMKDLPEESRNRILFDAIGGNKLSPEALMKKLDEIKSKGFESYFTPEIEESIHKLGKKLNNRKNLKRSAGIASTIGGAGLIANALHDLF